MVDISQDYAQRIPQYKLLLDKVQDTINQICAQNAIIIHAIRGRIKTFESFTSKIERKKYTNPWRQCDDLAAIRIICLFEDQVKHVVDALIKCEKLIVVESKKKKKQTDEFSYTAYHMIVQHKDFAKDYVCEIQIRTILQDAWSEMEHYVNYKQLSLDDKSQRKVNALAALFEVAEDQFKDIYESFQQLQSPQTNTDVELSAAAIYQYVKREFASSWNYAPDVSQLELKSEYEAVLDLAQSLGIATMGDFIIHLQKKLPQVLLQDATRSKDILNAPNQWPKLYDKVRATGRFHLPAIIMKRCFE